MKTSLGLQENCAPENVGFVHKMRQMEKGDLVLRRYDRTERA